MSDIEHIFRQTQAKIDRHFDDPPRAAILRRGESVDDKIDRLTSMAFYHADSLGRILAEISACHEGKLVQGKTRVSGRSGPERPPQTPRT